MGGSKKIIGKSVVTYEYVRSHFNYNKRTGVFTWAIPPQKYIPAGSVVGTPMSGYLVVSIKCVKFSLHRLAWLYVTGSWPIHEIDHIDGNKANNSWRNLRDVSHSENMQNITCRTVNSSGFRGVEFTASGKWAAYICVGGKKIRLGMFTSPKDAHAAHLKAKERYHPGFIIAANLAVAS